MAASKIQWCDRVWNPTVGCTRVSEGCQACYAEKFANRLEAMGRREYAGLTRKHGDGSVNWTGVVRTLPERLGDPLKWRKPQRVFVNSMSDLFHDQVPVKFIAEVFSIMAVCQNLTFQVLTKRPDRMEPLLGDPTFLGQVLDAMEQRADEQGWCMNEFDEWPLANVWLGVSVENQAAADERIPLLLQTPAAVRFLSCEPLLGPLDLTHVDLLPEKHRVDGFPWLNALTGVVAGPDDQWAKIDWVIAGGESSGPAERRLVEPCCRKGSPFPPSKEYPCVSYDLGQCAATADWHLKLEALDWLRSLRDQCQAAGVPWFLKQMGGPTPKSGGRTLDGRTWDEFPESKALSAWTREPQRGNAPIGWRRGGEKIGVEGSIGESEPMDD